MDVLALLTADHNRVRGLFERFREAQEADRTDDMQTVATKIVEDLEAHTTIEEEVFYPWAHELSQEIGEIVDEGIQEHHVAKTLIQEIGGLTPGDDEWVAKVTVLMESVEHHAEEEEQEMFPKIRSASDADTLTSQAEALLARKQELGAPTPDHAAGMSKSELIELAREQHIPGRSTMDLEELASTVDAR